MKKKYTLEAVEDVDFSVYAINSHAKAYRFCWSINKSLFLDFEKTQDQKIDKEMLFSRYFCEAEEGLEYNIITNRSSKGYFMPEQKSVNYFLIVNKKQNKKEKEKIINQLKNNKEVLFVFELDVTKSKYLERFIINDKKN